MHNGDSSPSVLRRNSEERQRTPLQRGALHKDVHNRQHPVSLLYIVVTTTITRFTVGCCCLLPTQDRLILPF